MDRLTKNEPKSTSDGFMEMIISKVIEKLPPDAFSNIQFIADRVRNFDNRLSMLESKIDYLIACENHGKIGTNSIPSGIGISKNNNAGEQS